MNRYRIYPDVSLKDAVPMVLLAALVPLSVVVSYLTGGWQGGVLSALGFAAAVFVVFSGLAVLFLRARVNAWIAASDEGFILRGEVARRLIPWTKVAFVEVLNPISTPKAFRGNLQTIVERLYEPAYGRRPTIEVDFTEPVAIASLPIPWYRRLRIVVRDVEGFVLDVEQVGRRTGLEIPVLRSELSHSP